MKKLIIILTFTFSVLLVCMSAADVGAEEYNIGELAEEFDVYDAAEALEYDAADFLAENGITPDSTEGITELDPSAVLSYMWKKLCSSAAAPLRLFGIIISVIIISAASGAAADMVKNQGSVKIYRTVTILTAVAFVVPSVEQCLLTAENTLVSGGDFMLCYVPVFAGICSAAGNITASAAYNAIVLMIAETVVKFVSEMIMPLISMCMAMSIIDAMNPGFSLSAITGVLKKWTSLLLGFIMTVFTGLLSVQSIVGVSADTIGVKAAKFVVSNFVPVVGGAVADAYSTMRSGLGMLRGAAGAFGIIAFTVMLLPPVLETLCMYLAMTAGEAAAEMFGAKELAGFFKGTASALSLVMAVLACFGVMFVISTIILMATGLGSSV